MQRSYDYSNVRDFRDIKNPTQLGEEAAKNTIDRLNVKKIKTGNYPIIFYNTISDAIIIQSCRPYQVEIYTDKILFTGHYWNKNSI